MMLVSNYCDMRLKTLEKLVNRNRYIGRHSFKKGLYPLRLVGTYY